MFSTFGWTLLVFWLKWKCGNVTSIYRIQQLNLLVENWTRPSLKMEERWSIGLPPIFENGDDFSDKENLSPPRTPKEFSDPFLTLSPICIETTSTPLHSISANTPRSLGKGNNFWMNNHAILFYEWLPVKWNGTCPFTPAEAQHRYIKSHKVEIKL